MSAGLKPNWLFSHSVTVYHFEPGPMGSMATPVPATEAVTGHMQLYSHVIRTLEGEELQAAGTAMLPYTTTLGPQDEIEYGGKRYRLTNISSPNLGTSTNAYTRAELL